MIYTRLATCFGWTWEYIDEFMTVPRLQEITEYWEQVPPLAESVAGLLGALRTKRPSNANASPVFAPTAPISALQEPPPDLFTDLAAFGIRLPPELLR